MDEPALCARALNESDIGELFANGGQYKAPGAVIRGILIRTDASGQVALPNGVNGVPLRLGASGNVDGGSNAVLGAATSYFAGAGTIEGANSGDVTTVHGFFFSSRRRHTRLTCDWSSDVSLPISRATARPIPLPPPVTKHTFPANCFITLSYAVSSSLSVLQRQDQNRGDGRNHGRPGDQPAERSEERRVGKEGRSRGATDDEERRR